jgi:hypothetical protein
MAMMCWICCREARGYGHVDIRFRVGHAQRYPIDWVFCSRRCQACFHRLYLKGIQSLERGLQANPGAAMNATHAELSARRACFKPLGQAAGVIGMDKPLGHYSQDEALQLIDAVVTAYVEAMVQEHERSKYPPVRMNLAPEVVTSPTGSSTFG